jgi:hypothetical protein
MRPQPSLTSPCPPFPLCEQEDEGYEMYGSAPAPKTAFTTKLQKPRPGEGVVHHQHHTTVIITIVIIIIIIIIIIIVVITAWVLCAHIGDGVSSLVGAGGGKKAKGGVGPAVYPPHHHHRPMPGEPRDRLLEMEMGMMPLHGRAHNPAPCQARVVERIPVRMPQQLVIGPNGIPTPQRHVMGPGGVSPKRGGWGRGGRGIIRPTIDVSRGVVWMIHVEVYENDTAAHGIKSL